MYSLYRAWLMRDAVTATLAAPPDVLINVGGQHAPSGHAPTAPKCHQFAAHRHVVTVHSGYLKALLTATPSQTVSVPNIGPEAFGPLLTYMYTGYLDVNMDNIYAVLLATHLLHMPRALDLCRTFLLQNQPQTLHLSPRLDADLPQGLLSAHAFPSHPDMLKRAEPREDLPPLVKPIASRKMLPLVYNPLQSSPSAPTFWPHLPYPLPHPPLMLPNDNSSFKSVHPVHEVVREKMSTPERVATPVKVPIKKRPKSPLAVPSTSTNRKTVLMRARSPMRPSSISPCLSDSSYDSDEVNVNVSCDESVEKTKPDKNKKLVKKFGEGGGHRGKVIIDVACCDGPVRFHRVLNDNYGAALDEPKVGEENVGVTSMRKELATKRAAEMSGSGGRKKVARVTTNGVEKQRFASDECRPVLIKVPVIEGAKPASDLIELRVPKYIPEIKEFAEGREVGIESVNDCVDRQVAATFSSTNDRADIADNSASGEVRIEQEENFVDLDTYRNASQPAGYESVIVKKDTQSREATEKPIQTTMSPAYFANDDQSPESEPTLTNLDQSAEANQDPPSNQPAPSSAAKPGAESIYTCVYCNHTFKSHYCYQKHARRHINPVALEAVGSKPDAVCVKLPEKVARREVRLLDMNVQYYPCKTCGSKFPSYYFVHKHRKLCHADETDDVTGSEESQTQSQSATISSV